MTQKSQRGSNLTQADRERGGRVSASKQERDARGKFAGTKGAARRTHEAHTEQGQQAAQDQTEEEPSHRGSDH